MNSSNHNLPPLTAKEQALIHKFNTNNAYTPSILLGSLRDHLEIAVQVELATIPLYLYTYYSLNRTAGTTPTVNAPDTSYSAVELFANQAGAEIMSVAVEEMLHLSLASNMLYAVGGQPSVYKHSPDFPANLPHHAGSSKFHLRKFNFEQLHSFLQVELPEGVDAAPECDDWQTIGQLYSYIRCLIVSDKITDADFCVQPTGQQMAPSCYSPNNTDTLAPDNNFNMLSPPQQNDAAAKSARFYNSDDSHEGATELLQISSKQEALDALATICDQGEGYEHTRWADTDKQHEVSHYFKYLQLQSHLKGYTGPPGKMTAPKPAKHQFSDKDLYAVVFDFPEDPKTADYPLLLKDDDGNEWPLQDISNFCNGLYQYMLILTETIYKVPGSEQKVFFNRAMHLSMIWMLDKLIQNMRTQKITAGKHAGKVFAPTFEDALGVDAVDAYAKLVELGKKIENTPVGWIFTSYVTTNNEGQKLPDVSEYWRATAKPNRYEQTRFGKHGVPPFPKSPPSPYTGVEMHACMGLNSCKGQDRFGAEGHPVTGGGYETNDCAGQGYCSTTADHTCHVLNSCKDQGGCGLYGTAEEQNQPGLNACQSLGSCATPINASRFSSDGDNVGKSVWHRARQVFLENKWPAIASERGLCAEQLPEPPNKEFFADGPDYAWIVDSVGDEGGGITACGSSGTSGANSCA